MESCKHQSHQEAFYRRRHEEVVLAVKTPRRRQSVRDFHDQATSSWLKRAMPIGGRLDLAAGGKLFAGLRLTPAR